MTRPWLEANGNTFAYRKLTHVASLKARIGWQSLRTDEFVDEGPYCVTGTDFQNGYINWSTAYHVSAERYQMDRNIQLAQGDLLVTKDGTIGKVAVVDELNAPATLNSGVFVVRPKISGLTTTFLGWVIRSKVFDDFVAYNFSGSTINHLYQNVFETFRFPFPDLPTQRQIADFLDRETARIDLLIEKKQRLVELLGEKRVVIITSKVTGSSHGESDGYNGGTRGLFRSIPNGWQRTTLRHLADGPKNGAWGSEAGEDEVDAICIRVADFEWANLSLKLEHPTTRSFKKKQFRNLRLQRGDIVIEKSGGGEKTPVGRVVSFNAEIDAVTSNFVARIRPHEGVWNRYFLYLLAAHYMSGYSHQFIKQNTGIQNLDDRNLFRSDVWIPDLPTQRQIADFLDRETARIDAVKDKTNVSIDRLKEYRSALITAAVTGQIDVSTYSEAGTTDRRLDAIQEEMGE